MNDDTKTNEDYRRILATANKLETIQSNLESVIDFFLAPIVKLYSKLCNDCLKLLFECEFKLDHYRKAEELVWRRIYHDIYRFQKTKRQRVKKHDECLMESHFISGIGFYSSLVVRLRSHYKIYDVPGVILPLNLPLGPLDNFVENQLLNEEESDHGEDLLCENNDISLKTREWARQAIYRSLVYMGDLARYLLETSQFDYRKLAFEFYRSASMNQPDHGLPFNQLATLSGGLNHNLDAVCNYMRCCLRLKPFEGAEGNMKKLFDLNKMFYEEVSKRENVSKISEVLASKEPDKAAESMMKAIIVTFIKLTSNFWTAISSSATDGNLRSEIIEETQLFFETLREALELEPIVPLAARTNIEEEFCPVSGGSSYTEKPKYVSPTIMYEFCSISIMLIAKCQNSALPGSGTTESKNQYVIDLVNTLALNLLHYSTSKCQKMIISKLQELRMGRQERLERRSYLRPPISGGDVNSSSEAISRRALSRLRQRKAATNYSDNNTRSRLTHHVHTEDSEMSELEETALSTIDALDISSDMSEDNDYQINDLIDLDSSSDDVSTLNQAKCPVGLSSFNNLSKPTLRPTRSQNYELERSMNLANSSNSLPVPDLLTGDIIEGRVEFKVTATSQSPLESPNGSDGREKLSLGPTDKEMNEYEYALAFIYTQTYLPTIKVLCDWLLSNGEIINSNVQSFYGFCSELGDLVTLLNDLRKITDTKDADLLTNSSMNQENSSSMSSESQNDETLTYRHTFDGPKWRQRFPLGCDFPLMNLTPLKSVHELNIEFDYKKELNASESGFITTQCIIAFLHALSAFLENKSFQ